jgi:predicted component of type VI protein secretion system
MAHWSDPLHGTPTRFRIRIGKEEEFALPKGVTLVGRDASCPLTIVDSLVSRRHARIECDGDEATIEDLGSRNGTRLNSVLVSGTHALRSGDRIGIGSCEILISVLDEGDAEWRDEPTGLLSVCAACRHCYAADAPRCPRCGAANGGAHTSESQAQARDETSCAPWSLAMLLEMVGKAMLVDNVKDAEKLMRRSATVVGDRLRAVQPPEPDELRFLEESARWIDRQHQDHAWSDWFVRLRAQLSHGA